MDAISGTESNYNNDKIGANENIAPISSSKTFIFMNSLGRLFHFRLKSSQNELLSLRCIPETSGSVYYRKFEARFHDGLSTLAFKVA